MPSGAQLDIAADGRLELILAVLDRLPPGDLEVMESALKPWVKRSRRLAERDSAIRELAARHYIALLHGRAIADALAKDLRRYETSSWHHERGKPPAGDAKRLLWHRILTLSEGKAVGSQRIREILSGVAGNQRRQVTAEPGILRR